MQRVRLTGLQQWEDRMRFGTFLEFSCPPGADTAECYARAFEHVDQAEAVGLDIVDVAEFHFTPNRVASSPVTLAAAIAGRTKRIKVGTSVLVLPLGNPIRMAEETATLDHVSNGRFELGVGRSGFQVSYDGYGVAYEESRDRFQEALDVIVGAWTNERFSYSGKYYSYSDVCLVPGLFPCFRCYLQPELVGTGPAQVGVNQSVVVHVPPGHGVDAGNAAPRQLAVIGKTRTGY